MDKWCWNSWILIWNKMILNFYLRLYTKINSKWIINLNVNANAIKSPGKKKKKGNLHDLGICKDL